MALDKSFTNQEFKVVGTRPPRPDGVDKVTGRARYGADAFAPGQLVGLVLRSPHAHAKIKKIDTSKAEKLKGVKAVITSADLPDLTNGDRGMLDTLENCMARGRALYDGHAVAAVAAIDADTARQALKLIKIDYEKLPHVTDVDEAMKPGAPIVQPHIRTIGVDPKPTKGVERIAGVGVRTRRRRRGIRASRRHRRTQLSHRADAPGLHRTARVPRERRPGRPGRTVGDDARPLHVPQPLRDAARHGRRQTQSHVVGNRRRLRRQDPRVDGTRGPCAVAQGEPSGQARDDARRSVPRDGSDVLDVDRRQNRRPQGRHDHRRNGGTALSGRRVSVDLGHARRDDVVCVLRPRQRQVDRLRRARRIGRR